MLLQEGECSYMAQEPSALQFRYKLFSLSICFDFLLPLARWLKYRSTRRISCEGYSRLLITRRIEYSTRISSSTNTEYMGDGRRVRARRGSALSRLNAPVDPRVCERDQTCFCSSGPCTGEGSPGCSSRREKARWRETARRRETEGERRRKRKEERESRWQRVSDSRRFVFAH